MFESFLDVFAVILFFAIGAVVGIAAFLFGLLYVNRHPRAWTELQEVK